MNELSLERLAPLSGVLFLPLIVGSFILLGDTPDQDEPSRAVAEYWLDNDSQIQFSALLSVLAAVTLAWFGGCLRVLLRRSDTGLGRLSAVAFGGSLIAATGILIFAAIDFTGAETAGDVPASVTHTFAVMDENFFFPVAGGFIVMLLATGLLALRTGVLPAWLGWVSIVIGVIICTPVGFAGFIASLIWVPLVGVLMYLRDRDAVDAGPTPPTGTAPPPAV